MITKFIIDQNAFFDFCATTQYIPDTVTVLMAVKPFKVGNAPCCYHDDIRVQPRYGVIVGINRVSDIDAKMVYFSTKPVCNAADFFAPTCCCCQGNLSTETIKRLKKNNLMTT